MGLSTVLSSQLLVRLKEKVKMQLTQPQTDTLEAFTYSAIENGRSAFPGMSYEEGIQAVIDVMRGNITVADAVGE